MTGQTRADFLKMDQADPLGKCRDRFLLRDGLIYLDGNSLGALPAAVPERVQRAITGEWGKDLISSWNVNRWIDLPQRVGDRIGALVGAAPGQVVAGDSTSVNLFKLLAAALKMVPEGRRVILSDPGNFPTDLYMVQGLRELLGENRCQLRLVEETEITGALDDDVALVMLTHVNFRSGRMHDMRAVTRAVQASGALMLWDLSHSAGALPVDLDGCNADFAVGCGYKYLNGGPGAPAFLYVAARHREQVSQPLSGWMGHASPFVFDIDYTPAAGVGRYLCGTPPVLAMLALETALESCWSGVDMAVVREKSLRLGTLFIDLVEQRCAGHGFSLASPRENALRGSQVSFAHPEGYAIMQALIKADVVGDFRAPNLLRFGFTPLYTRYVDIWDAVDRLALIMEQGSWNRPEFHRRAAVT